MLRKTSLLALVAALGLAPSDAEWTMHGGVDNIRYSPLRFSGIRADGQARWDFSAIKNFQIKERVKVQYRAEVLNAWNHPILLATNTTPTNTSFGEITVQEVPRAWQM